MRHAVTILRTSNQGYFSKQLSYKRLQDTFKVERCWSKQSLCETSETFQQDIKKQNEGTDINLTSHPNVVSPIGTMPLMLCPVI